MKALRAIALAILSLIGLFGVCFFIYSAITEYDLLFILPAIVFAFLATVFIYLFFLETLIGYRSFSYENKNIIVKRKERTIAVIPKCSVEKLTVVYDVISKRLDGKEEIHYFTFLHNKKRYCVDAKEFGEQSLNSFISDLEYKKTTNNLYYFLLMFG